MPDYDASFILPFKKYDESKTYYEYESQEVGFDPAVLQVESVTDITTIMNEINSLSLKLFQYGSLCDAQARVVQQLEDEFERWKAATYFNDKIEDKQFKTEKAKERHLMVQHSDIFWQYQNNLSDEQYRLSLLKRVVHSLESYGYKLHDLKDYNLAIERNS